MRRAVLAVLIGASPLPALAQTLGPSSGSASAPSLSANTMYGNATSSTATATGVSLPTCNPASTSIIYTGGSGWSCTTTTDAVTQADLDAMIFGDGTDGNVTCSGASSLSRDMYYNNLTLSTGCAITTNGYKVFVSGILDATAAPAGSIKAVTSAGGNASGFVGGSNGAPSLTGYLGTVINASTSGHNGATTAGLAATAAGCASAVGGLGGASGAGGAGTNAGTSGTAATALTNAIDIRRLQPELAAYITASGPTMVKGGCGSAGGSSGGGDGTNSGGGGGGGGGSGQVIYLAARTVNRGGSTAAGTVQALGSNGGNGGTPSAGNTGGGGGGAGGGGGWIYFVSRFQTGTTATGFFDATGGNGGTGGTGLGTGVGGDGGGSGGGGRIDVYNVGAGTQTINGTVAAVAGGSHSGTTGGTGATATTRRVSL